MAVDKCYMFKQFLNFEDFTISYLHAEKKGSVWYEGTSPEWAEPYPYSEGEHAEYNVWDNCIFLLISGKMSTESRRHHSVKYVAGQGMHMTRSKGRYKITTLENNTESVCITPNKKIIYQRSLASLNSGESIKFPVVSSESFCFVAKGKVKINGKQTQAFDMIKYEPNEIVEINCIEQCYVLRMWE